MSSGKFITLEGIEGVGKSTHTSFIVQYLEQRGQTVLKTREPGGTPLAEDLRSILLKEYPDKTLPDVELLILYAGRCQHVERVIKPALARGEWVVCDRFSDATFAYQGWGRGVSIERIETLDRWALGEFCPSLTIILDAPVAVAMERIQKDRHLDRFEREQYAFFEHIRQGYQARAAQDPKRCRIISASDPMEVVQDNIRQLLASWLEVA